MLPVRVFMDPPPSEVSIDPPLAPLGSPRVFMDPPLLE
jgi:hypothetical protein